MRRKKETNMDITQIAQQAGMTENEAAAALAGTAIGGMLGGVLVLVLVWYVIRVIAGWKIFTKAGEAGWKSIIPFYNVWVEYKLIWDPRMFFVALALAILVSLGQIPNMVVAVIAVVASIGMLVFNAIACSKLAKAFGRGTGFAVGLFFLEPIFRVILGFGSAQYQGNPSAR